MYRPDLPDGADARGKRTRGWLPVLYKPASFGYVYEVMRRTAVQVLFIVALSLGGMADARTHVGAAASVNGDGQLIREGRAGKTRRTRARKRRKAAGSSSVKPGRSRTSPASQPAHMAPQLEDMPPVKPRKTKPPKPDIRNPSQ